jgi:hypothetical protein
MQQSRLTFPDDYGTTCLRQFLDSLFTAALEDVRPAAPLPVVLVKAQQSRIDSHVRSSFVDLVRVARAHSRRQRNWGTWAKKKRNDHVLEDLT